MPLAQLYSAEHAPVKLSYQTSLAPTLHSVEAIWCYDRVSGLGVRGSEVKLSGCLAHLRQDGPRITPILSQFPFNFPFSFPFDSPL